MGAGLAREAAAAAVELGPAELRAACDPATLPFRSTEELPSLDGLIGQERALAATSFGVGMKHPGYNLFVLGPHATGKRSSMTSMLTAAARGEPRAVDHCYVHNFTDPYRPTALTLPAGRGREVRDAMVRFVGECTTRLPRAFDSEEFSRQRAELAERLSQRSHTEIAKLEDSARAADFVVIRRPGGLAVAPAPLGKPLTEEEFAELPDAMKQRLTAAAAGLNVEVETTLRQLRELEREARDTHARLVQDTAKAATHALVQELRERFVGLDPVQRYLDAVEADIVAHAEHLRSHDEPQPTLPFGPPADQFLDRYRVNLLIDRTEATGAPVVFEPHPTYGNLLGRIEHRVQFGALVTDFTLIKPGALHRANGGYLILDARTLLQNFMTWDGLKRALRSASIEIREPLEEFRLANAATLAPEPIPLTVKVILLGTPALYYLLDALDDDFRELFKVKVDFDDSLPREAPTEMLYARFVAGVCREQQLPQFSAAAVAKLVEHGSRMVAHRERLTTRLGLLADVMREAAFWAAERHQTVVDAEDVQHALEQKIYRASLIEERIARAIADGDLVIATEGATVGQVNGIAVLATGDHAFGKPARITARTFVGEPGVVDIEREAKLGGRVHSKGVMILSGFLAGRYAREWPLTIAASIAFEQQYDEIDGDSASSAELYALLSSLAGVPLSQALGVTGSVNQHGEIQAVGGINEKIEGFFDVCRARGLTGDQGVVIPRANVRHLMLREDVVDAVRASRFHVFPVATVDEGLALLTGRPAGVRGEDGHFSPGSVNAAVERVLAQNVERLRELRAPVAPGNGARGTAVRQ